jgi:6-phosphogluconolactonase
MTTVVADLPALARAAADAVAAAAAEAVTRRGVFTIALSGGSTPRRLYEALARPPAAGGLETSLWPHVQLLWGDERAVPPEHRDSNYRMVREALLEAAPIPAANVHRIEAERDPHDAAARYEETLRHVVAGRSSEDVPVIDLVLLGLGEDGHTASLFPGDDMLQERGRLVTAGWVAAVAAWRITLTLPVLAAARQVLGLAAGPEKAAAVAGLLAPSGSGVSPARLVTDRAGQARWIIDRAAAARVPGLVP